ncbi:MAG: DUF899 family protein, partial [Pseudomonadota bacterium]
MSTPHIANREKWLVARKDLLAEEKAFLRQRDALSAKRRDLPWVKIDEDYQFDSANGRINLSNLFGDKSQLIIYHFMMGEDWEQGCPSCSFWADGFNGTTEHLAQRDAAFVCVSNTPIAKIDAYKKRMGWTFKWVSCHGSSFNHHYQASFTAEEMAAGKMQYNYR